MKPGRKRRRRTTACKRCVKRVPVAKMPTRWYRNHVQP